MAPVPSEQEASKDGLHPQTAPGLAHALKRHLSGLSFTTLLALGALLRLVLILYGVHHDKTHALKYTDVDYYVFNDAASYVLPGHSSAATGPLAKYIPWRIGSPYDRATYRYTPILALLLLPNHLLQPTFGKFLFCASDILAALLLYRILVQQYRTPASRAKLYVAACWLFNPFIANISSRGSSESLLGVLVLTSLFLANDGRWISSAVIFGLAVHFKIYPVVYASAVLAKLSDGSYLPKLRQIRFGVASFGSFMAANAVMYAVWGMPFIKHTYLYHLTRLDHRHNFSQHFYPIYLSLSPSASGSASASAGRLGLPWPTTTPAMAAILTKLATSSFVPQLGLTLFVGFRLGGKITLAYTWFLQTLVFTSFNRVCTSQYFMWFLWFLPLVIATTRLTNRAGAGLLALWIVGQALWLSTAYQLEFEGKPVFLELWGASNVFFAINVYLLWKLLEASR